MRGFVKKRKEEIEAKQRKQGRASEEISYETLNLEITIVRSMFKWLIKTKRATENPGHLVGMYATVKRQRILEEGEEERLFEAIGKLDSRASHVEDMATIYLYAGMRRMEVYKLHRDWIHLNDGDNGIIVIPKAIQKSKKEDRRVPLNSVTRPIIERRLANVGESGYLFESRRKKLRYPKEPHRWHFESIGKGWKSAIKKAGLDGTPGVSRLRIHDMRHNFGDRVAENHDIEDVKTLLGHRNLVTAERYMRRSDAHRAKVSESVCNHRGVPSKSTTGPKLKIVSGQE